MFVCTSCAVITCVCSEKGEKISYLKTNNSDLPKGSYSIKSYKRISINGTIKEEVIYLANST